MLSAAQHAMHVVYRHLPLLESFVRNPGVHLRAAADRRLFGGPFVHLPRERVPDIQRLIDRTTVQCARLIRLGRDLREMDERLQESATGYSLSELYLDLPASLAGLIEFVYDLNNHPKLRLYEDLLYDDDLAAGTEEILLAPIRDEDRRFFMSTPRLPEEGTVIFPMTFADSRLDLISGARTRPVVWQELAQTLGLPESQRTDFSRLFTTQPPARHDVDYTGPGVRLRYFGHACVLIQTAQTNVLIDPMLATENDHGDSRFTFHDLPDRIDYVILSHGHHDHCVAEMLIQLRHRVGEVLVPASNQGTLADPSLRLILRRLGIERVRVLSPFDTVSFGDGRITSLPFPGEHVDLDIYSRHGIFVEARERRFAFLVDSDGWDRGLFRRIAARLGPRLDALFLGMECHGAPLTWLYGPLMTRPISRKDDESRRLSGLNSERAWNVLQEFDVPRVFVYAMGQEPWLRYIMGLQYEPDSIQLKEVAAFLERCRQTPVMATHLFGHLELTL